MADTVKDTLQEKAGHRLLTVLIEVASPLHRVPLTITITHGWNWTS
jgi:hypothetical protein